MKVIHSYEKKNLRKLRRNEEADCTKCAFAEKTPDIEGGYVYLCHAALYDIETLSCFVPKPENQNSMLPWYMNLFNPNIFRQEEEEDCLKYLEEIGPKASPDCLEAVRWSAKALKALRPVSREQVEKVWRGEWNQDEHGRVVCNRCGSIAAIGTENALHNAKKYDRFCFYCGAPMTDEAVEMVVRRLEELHENP